MRTWTMTCFTLAMLFAASCGEPEPEAYPESGPPVIDESSAGLDANIVAGARSRPAESMLNLVPSFADGAVYSVDNVNGIDCPGCNPYKTIKYAVSQLTAGMVLYVKYGTYDEGPIVTGANGSASYPIFVIGQRGGFANSFRPKIRPIALPEDDVYPLVQIQHSYWIVRDLDFDKAGRGVTNVQIGTDAQAVSNVVLQNNLVHGGHWCPIPGVNQRSVNGVSMFGSLSDVLVVGNTIYDNAKYKDVACSVRDDAHGIVILPDAHNVLIKNNTIYNNTGDGMQCMGHRVNEHDTSGTTDPVDITLEDNTIYTTSDRYGLAENAIDIKSCGYLTIRGSREPLSNLASVSSDNHFYGFRRANDENLAGFLPGSAVVVHFHAQSVLMENTHISDSCMGISVGKNDTLEEHFDPTLNVVVRRNLIDLGDAPDADCEQGDGQARQEVGDGIRLTKASNVDVNNNTIRGPSRSGIRVARDLEDKDGTLESNDLMHNVDVWNNIIVDADHWLDFDFTKFPSADLESDYNHAYHTDGTSNRFYSAVCLLPGCTVQTWATDTLALWRTHTGQDGNSAFSDPQFSPVPNVDLELAAGSPALNSGVNIDMSGTRRWGTYFEKGWIEKSNCSEGPPAPLDDCNLDGVCESWLDYASNCGACGVVCSTAHGTPVCTSGECRIQSCSSGYGDCDKIAATGCEVSLQMDEGNCGACGAICRGVCNAGVCAPITITSQESVGDIVAYDGLAEGVYWTAGDDHRVRKFDGEFVLDRATTTGAVGGIALDEDYVYFVTGALNLAGVSKVAHSGGAVTSVFSGENKVGDVEADPASGGNLYYVAGGSLQRSVRKIAKTGGSSSLIFSSPDYVKRLAVAGSYLYIAHASGVDRVPIAGGASSLVINGRTSVTGLAVCGTTAFLADAGTGDVLKVPVGGGAATTLAYSQVSLSDVACDGKDFLYYVAGGTPGGSNGFVKRMTQSGGSPLLLFSARPGPRLLTRGGSRVYWAEDDTDTVNWAMR